jgi:dTDP-4-amino-4,6-dideoxygalactose transaminase
MFVPPQARYRMYGGVSNYLRAVRDFVTGRVYAGDDTARVERRLATCSQMADAVLVAQGRFGLYLALRQLIKPGQEVILSPYTIYDVVNMVRLRGHRA